jgi:hypothetical protein
MKKFYVGLAVLLMVAALFSIASPAANAEVDYCGTPKLVTLYAGQTIDAGTVTVSNDADNLYVTYTTANGWLLSETHLHVADSLAGIPQTNKGNPKVGNFAYQRSYDPPVSEDTYVIAKSDLSLDANNSVVIAAHAAVVQVDDSGNVIASETGWGDGDPFVDRGSWAMYFQYTWQDCNGGGGGGSDTETAFAFGGEDAQCFLDLDLDNDGVGDFNRWGWTNGPLAEGSYSFDIYAGAGQCDLSKGTLVGTLSVAYSSGTAIVTYQTDSPYTMVETHLYVGSDILATNNGDYTVAPGQYPTIHGELGNITSDSYTVSGLSGDIYVVAHATVAGF